ncbi:hypothetical protein NXW60_01660 [Bacteroides fragilis]|nr:hypothetical protein NXW60_01660 [Bacteroides fragilis]
MFWQLSYIVPEQKPREARSTSGWSVEEVLFDVSKGQAFFSKVNTRYAKRLVTVFN